MIGLLLEDYLSLLAPLHWSGVDIANNSRTKPCAILSPVTLEPVWFPCDSNKIAQMGNLRVPAHWHG